MPPFWKTKARSNASSQKARLIIRAKISTIFRNSSNATAQSALAWIKVGDETTSSLLKVLGRGKDRSTCENCRSRKRRYCFDRRGQKIGRRGNVSARLRKEIAKRENLIPKGVYKPLWVTEFPMFEYNEDSGNYDPMHHPFTSFWTKTFRFSNARSTTAKKNFLAKSAPALTTS